MRQLDSVKCTGKTKHADECARTNVAETGMSELRRREPWLIAAGNAAGSLHALERILTNQA